MGLMERVANAIGIARKRPRPGTLLRHRKEDTMRDYPADGITPQGIIAIFREADSGSLSAQMALFEQMEEKDAHLFSVANTRRLAITGLPWEVVSAADMRGFQSPHGTSQSRKLADDAAAYCDAVLRNTTGFERALEHMALALGRNISLVEIVWEATPDGLSLAELQPVDFARLLLGDLDEVRVLTEAEKYDGIPLPPDKFIVHTPHSANGHPARGGLLRATALAYLGKHFAIKDWLIFAEIFGMPIRMARYAPNATPEEKRELLEMLKQLGADATGVFSKAVEVEIQQTRYPGEVNLYEQICIYFDREISKAWLGQTLTTDTIRMQASAGAAKVHERVRQDLRDDDIRREAETLRRDLLTPLVRFQFGDAAPVPHFRRITDSPFTPEQLSRVLDVAVNQLGAKVPTKWAHASLGLPKANEGEPVLPGTRREQDTNGGSTGTGTGTDAGIAAGHGEQD